MDRYDYLSIITKSNYVYNTVYQTVTFIIQLTLSNCTY